jgi:hypothetical protein
MFHRRQAEPSRTLTVVVEVVATVNDQGRIVPQETRTLEATPDVPKAPLPSVPAVPPFPSDLAVPSVPAFPFPSGYSTLPLGMTSQDPDSLPLPTATTLRDFPSLIPSDPALSSLNSTTTSECGFSSSFNHSNVTQLRYRQPHCLLQVVQYRHCHH